MGKLPATKSWKGVVALITGGASAAEVAAETAIAAERSLDEASRNPVLRYAFWLLTQIPLAAREADFSEALRRLKLDVGDAPNLLEIGAAMLEAVDRYGATVRRNDDLGEIATKVATESLISVASRSEDSLFGTTYASDEARASLRGLSTNGQFGVLARDFISRLLQNVSGYFLSRTLPDHVGVHRRFQSLVDHHAFEQALVQHCRETSFIMQQFACDWFSKANFEGGITTEKAGGFLHHALVKVRAELALRRTLVHA